MTSAVLHGQRNSFAQTTTWYQICYKSNVQTIKPIQDGYLSRPLIVKGDKTTHGGTVISADPTFHINSKHVARLGDLTVCPKCKGIFAITSASSDLVDCSGNGYARHLGSTACGAKLISGQLTTTWSDESSIGAPAAEDKTDALAAASSIATSTTSGVCLDCLLKAAASGSATVVRD